jgi:colicin import membrane protein
VQTPELETEPPQIVEKAEVSPHPEIEKTLQEPIPVKKIEKTTPKPKKSTPTVVKKKSTSTKKVTKTQPKAKTVAKKSVPQPKKEAKPKVNAATVKETARKAKQKELIASAQKSMAKIGKTNTLKNASTTLSTAIPDKIGNLQIETFSGDSGEVLTTQELTYYDQLASRLKLGLKLPEFGAVKIKLTLERTGKYVKALVINAENSINRKYIEKTLPSIKFPPFGSNFQGQTEYTFVIAFNNE